MVPLATSRRRICINACGEPPEVAASVVGEQMAGPSSPTLAEGDEALAAAIRPSLEAAARMGTVVPKLEPPPMERTPQPTTTARREALTSTGGRPTSSTRGALGVSPLGADHDALPWRRFSQSLAPAHDARLALILHQERGAVLVPGLENHSPAACRLGPGRTGFALGYRSVALTPAGRPESVLAPLTA